MTQDKKFLNLLNDLTGKAKTAGADACDALYGESVSMSLSQRLGNPEHLERSESMTFGLRVFIGQKQAIVSSSDSSPDALDELVERAIAMARSVPEDPYCGLADTDLLATEFPDLDSADPVEASAEDMSTRASRAEEAALAVEGVTNSEGAEAGWGRSTMAIVTSTGFSHVYEGSHHSLSASVLAGEGTHMERDYDYAGAVYGEDLPDPEELGRSAGEKAVRRLNPKKVETTQVPVVYDPRVARSIVGHLSGAINGAAVARGTTFLKDKMDQVLFPEAISIIDDPHRRRGLHSKPFDGECVATRPMRVIDKGRLTSWFLDLRSARQLGLTTNGHAARGVSAPPSPSPSNLYLAAGTLSPDQLMAGIQSGFYITELIGFGVNNVTGDYSRGASGFWITDGKIDFPVSEMTVAGNLNDMFANLSAADDLDFKYGTDAPTLRIDGMTVAGK